MRARDEDGSILILTIGYALLALVLVFVCVDATSLYLAQKRTQAAADAAALAGADGFTLEVHGDQPRAELTDAGVREQAEALVAADGEVALVSASTPDGVSARVTVSTTWHPPISSIFVPAGVVLEATATSRTLLD
ncbi:pilus assembly protein TadG-related protein [Microbacterium sp. KSW4-11]|uniref:Pilus assembly protein TadG-related protein n=1 Tax=Microbacterium gawkjiense TaxID=3067309 RepID=A0ABU3GC18_9MICO|nr:pilus assembly protein TadG-related protein [Microbacterium sp. KSW4-11]MDT3317354.1 pilus assembly protein TadG-related protein [Microbacterium sp. KSW4-11]